MILLRKLCISFKMTFKGFPAFLDRFERTGSSFCLLADFLSRAIRTHPPERCVTSCTLVVSRPHRVKERDPINFTFVALAWCAPFYYLELEPLPIVPRSLQMIVRMPIVLQLPEVHRLPFVEVYCPSDVPLPVHTVCNRIYSAVHFDHLSRPPIKARCGERWSSLPNGLQPISRRKKHYAFFSSPFSGQFAAFSVCFHLPFNRHKKT